MGEEVVRVRGNGGGEWDVTVPPPGTPQREAYDEKVAKGDWVLVPPAAPARKAAAARPEPKGG